MSDYQLYLSEKNKIDEFFEKGFEIKHITENLSGTFLNFERVSDEKIEKESLHLLTAEARKYIATQFIPKN